MRAPSSLLTPDTARSLSLIRTLGEPERSPHIVRQVLGWDASSRYLLSVRNRGENQLRWWDLEADRNTPLFTRPLAGGVAAWFLPDSQTLLSVTFRGALQTWSITDGALLSTVTTGMSVSSACLSLDGTRLLLTGSAGRVLLWDLRKSWLIWRRDDRALFYGCALSADGAFAAAGAAEEREGAVTLASLRLWEAKTGKLVGSRSFESFRIWTAAFVPSGDQVIAADTAGRLLFLSLPSLDVVRVVEGPASGTLQMEFNPAGSLLAASPDTSAFVVLNADDGQTLFAYSDLDDMEGSSVSFSPDGRFVSWGMDDGKVGIWGVAPSRKA
ncbi:WD40 repeat domain-containing protein [Corallococcus praedator]|uniref:WD40 repeat domain-containing protein n=1 Tax=Corallococcus praedator TaxID=2316724 RepID=A0ABX9QKM3_9BACT|nr:WD40 repeat domain-containing protein [Corallococcus sp. CA031C]RKI11557.1 WD40 repeat domain-containing protein [Corallococcus praedator]